MELDFVSLVPAGDDPHAQVVIAKAAPHGADLYASSHTMDNKSGTRASHLDDSPG
jgi:hypothetical protein